MAFEINGRADYSAHWSSYGISSFFQGMSMYVVGPLTYPYMIESGRVAGIGCTGLSMRLIMYRFAGGLTQIVVSISSMIYGTTLGQSGSLGFSGLPPAGSTLLFGQVGDVLGVDVSTGGAFDIFVTLVLKKTQDVVTFNGI